MVKGKGIPFPYPEKGEVSVEEFNNYLANKSEKIVGPSPNWKYEEIHGATEEEEIKKAFDDRENSYRRFLSYGFNKVLREKNMTPELLSEKTGVHLSQIKSLLHWDYGYGGELTIRTIIRCAYYLGINLHTELRDH